MPTNTADTATATIPNDTAETATATIHTTTVDTATGPSSPTSHQSMGVCTSPNLHPTQDAATNPSSPPPHRSVGVCTSPPGLEAGGPEGFLSPFTHLTSPSASASSEWQHSRLLHQQQQQQQQQQQHELPQAGVHPYMSEPSSPLPCFPPSPSSTHTPQWPIGSPAHSHPVSPEPTDHELDVLEGASTRMAGSCGFTAAVLAGSEPRVVGSARSPGQPYSLLSSAPSAATTTLLGSPEPCSSSSSSSLFASPAGELGCKQAVCAQQFASESMTKVGCVYAKVVVVVVAEVALHTELHSTSVPNPRTMMRHAVVRCCTKPKVLSSEGHRCNTVLQRLLSQATHGGGGGGVGCCCIVQYLCAPLGVLCCIQA
eukprot:1157952-Pelagomonas_calceolata.AAC.6